MGLPRKGMLSVAYKEVVLRRKKKKNPTCEENSKNTWKSPCHEMVIHVSWSRILEIKWANDTNWMCSLRMKVSNASNVKHCDAWAQHARTNLLLTRRLITLISDFWMADLVKDTDFTSPFPYSFHSSLSFEKYGGTSTLQDQMRNLLSPFNVDY